MEGVGQNEAQLKIQLEAKEKNIELLRENNKAASEELEQYKVRGAGEQEEFKNKINEQKKAIENLETSLEAEKAAHSKALEEFTAAKDQLNQNLTTKEEEAKRLNAYIEKLKGEVEEQKRVSAEDKVKGEKDLQATTSKHAEEKAALDQQIEELNKKIQDSVERLQHEEALHQAAIKECNDLEAKLRLELAAHKDSIKILNEKIEKSKVEMEEQFCVFTVEKVEMQSVFDNEIRQLEAEKIEFKKSHEALIKKLYQRLDHTQSAKLELLKQYQDLKQAVLKMVEEVGVRPIILPSAKNSSRTRNPYDDTEAPSKRMKYAHDAVGASQDDLHEEDVESEQENEGV